MNYDKYVINIFNDKYVSYSVSTHFWTLYLYEPILMIEVDEFSLDFLLYLSMFVAITYLIIQNMFAVKTLTLIINVPNPF